MLSDPRPPKFGSRLDFDRAILELKWIGSKDEEVLKQLGVKYNFPPEFVLAGFYGLKSEDTLMRSSKWWPIISQWNEQYEEAALKVKRAAAYGAKAGSDLLSYLVVAIATVFFLFLYANLGIAISGVSVSIGLFIALYRRGEEWNLKLEEEIHRAEVDGYDNIAQDFVRLAEKSPLFAYFAYKRFSKERYPRLAVRPLEVNFDKKGRAIPTFELLENVEQEYQKRALEIDPGVKILTRSIRETLLNTKPGSNSSTGNVRLLSIEIRNGNLKLSNPIEGCRVGLKQFGSSSTDYLPWLISNQFHLEGSPDDSLSEIWKALSKSLTFEGKQIAVGSTVSVLIGFGLESTGNFYFATNPFSAVPLKEALEQRKKSQSVIGSQPFKIVLESSSISRIESNEFTMIGTTWQNVFPRQIYNVKRVGKKISFGMDKSDLQ